MNLQLARVLALFSLQLHGCCFDAQADIFGCDREQQQKKEKKQKASGRRVEEPKKVAECGDAMARDTYQMVEEQAECFVLAKEREGGGTMAME
jgi:hypothetical protein